MNPFENILSAVRQKRPLVHFITNYVTVNDCANMTLALGGSPSWPMICVKWNRSSGIAPRWC